MAVESCQKQWCDASGAAAPGPSRQAEPNGTKGRKFYENFGASKVEVLEIVARGKLWVWDGLRCLGVVELFERHGIFGLLDSSQDGLDKFKYTQTLENIYPPSIGTPQNSKTIFNPLDLFLCSWYFMLEAEHSRTTNEQIKQKTLVPVMRPAINTVITDWTLQKLNNFWIVMSVPIYCPTKAFDRKSHTLKSCF